MAHLKLCGSIHKCHETSLPYRQSWYPTSLKDHSTSPKVICNPQYCTDPTHVFEWCLELVSASSGENFSVYNHFLVLTLKVPNPVELAPDAITASVIR